MRGTFMIVGDLLWGRNAPHRGGHITEGKEGPEKKATLGKVLAQGESKVK